MEPCKISVIIPCFNHGEFLPEAVASVTRLRRNDVELIVVDDGSTDERTRKEMDALIAQGIKVVRQANKGLAAARNAGIKIARGEFIIPLDSDNRIRENYLVSGVKLLQHEPSIGIVYGNAEYFGEKTGLWTIREFNLIALALGNYIDACALYRKSVWESVQGYDEQMPWMGYEDWDFWLRVASFNWGFAHLNEIAFDYRVRKGSMIETTNRHAGELISYIFNKPENRLLQLIKNKEMEIDKARQRLAEIEKSKDYRVGRFIMNPARKLKRMVGKR
jgi:glycosyltransferase involved in cell wall biosynthesis